MTATLRPPSRTAILTAVGRALHREEPPPWVLDDTLALALAGDEGPPLAVRMREELPNHVLLSFTRWVCVRARVPEEIVERGIGGGIRQYVILGAGLDSFAYRRHDLSEEVRVFEVDHPASQAWKRSRLAELGFEQPRNLVFVPVDFEHQTLIEALRGSGFDPDSKAVVSWLGVTMYLTRDAIEMTLRALASLAPGSHVVLTYDVRRDELGDTGKSLRDFLTRFVTEVDEPFVTRFTTEEIVGLLGTLGFREITDIGPREAADRYFPGRADVKFGGGQRLIVATVEPPATPTQR